MSSLAILDALVFRYCPEKTDRQTHSGENPTHSTGVDVANDNRPFLLGEFATSDVKEEGENKAAVITSPQQFAARVKSERQNAAN